MSLKDAIRQAVDERDNQSKGESTEITAIIDATPTPTTEETTRQSVGSETDGAAPTTNSQDKTSAPKTRTTTALPKTKAPSKLKLLPSSTTVNTANSKAVQREPEKANDENSEVEMAALTIRVPRAHRLHWLISAKKEDTSLTAAITEALNARFGEPTD